MANRKECGDDRLVLEISGPQITAEKFELGLRSFLAIIKNVAKEVSDQPKPVRWLVSVEPGSLRVEFRPEPVKAPANKIATILDTIENGIISAEAGLAPPRYFSDRALTKVGKLASIVDGAEDGLDRVQVWRNGKPHPITAKTVAHVDSLVGIQSRDWGTIEGKLQTITERRVTKFVVYDPVTDRPTHCYFDDEILDEVVDAFGQRVSVSGLIRYRGDGEPVSIDVEEFRVLPTDDLLPSVDEVRGILGRAD